MTRAGRSRIIAHASSRVSRFLRGSIVPTKRMNRSGRWRRSRAAATSSALMGLSPDDTPWGMVEIRDGGTPNRSSASWAVLVETAITRSARLSELGTTQRVLSGCRRGNHPALRYIARSWTVMTEGEPTSITGRAPTAPKKTSGLRRRSRAGHCTWRPTRGTSGDGLYAMLGVPSTNTPGGTYTVKRQSGRSTAIARRIWLVYTPTPAQGRAKPMPSTATCKPVIPVLLDLPTRGEGQGGGEHYRKYDWFRFSTSKCSRASPVPRTTEVCGSSASTAGMPVCIERYRSRPPVQDTVTLFVGMAWIAPLGVDRDPLDLGADRGQLAGHVFVAALHMPGVVEETLALGAQGGDHQRRA